MNPHNVAIWHPSHSDGVVLWVWFLAGHHREPDVEVCQPEEEAGGPPDLLEESNKEDEEFSSDKGFPHAHTLSMAQGHKVVRSEELPVLVEEPFKRDWGKSSPLVRSSTSLG